MKLDITLERLAEITDCIVDCGLDRDEAFEYAKSVLLGDAIEVKPKKVTIENPLKLN